MGLVAGQAVIEGGGQEVELHFENPLYFDRAGQRLMVTQFDLHVIVHARVPGTSLAIEWLAGTGDDAPPRLREQLPRGVTDAATGAGDGTDR